MVVNCIGYEMCIVNEGVKEYIFGDDRISFLYGFSYYIGIYDDVDCLVGLKMVIRVISWNK